MLNIPHTLLIAVLFIAFTTALGWLPIWFQDRRHKAVFWGVIAGFTFGAGMACRAALPFHLGIMLGNGLMILAHAFIWTAFRSLRKCAPQPVFILLPVAIWLGLCFVPVFQANVNLRIFSFGVLSAYLNALAIWEVSLLQRGSRFIRGWVLSVLGIQTLIYLLWAGWTITQPVTTGAAFSSIPGIAFILFGATGSILLLGPAIVVLDKELSDLRYLDTANSDFTTGVSSRQHFEQALTQHVNRAAKHAQPLALLMVDPDRFSNYNDLYGHDAGDKCLQALAAALKECCRPNDVVGRYGGEEFAILLPDTTPEIAQAIARRVQLKIRDLRLEHVTSPRGIVTASLGLATLAPRADTTPTAFAEQAERALRQAKRTGRDKISIAGEEGGNKVVLLTK
jgi:diguanylate cyclase (GGDEF)-like protein